MSTRTLADRAGVTPSVVHYPFPSLQALQNEAAVGLTRQALAEAETVLAAARTPVDGVEAMLASSGSSRGHDPARHRGRARAGGHRTGLADFPRHLQARPGRHGA